MCTRNCIDSITCIGPTGRQYIAMTSNTTGVGSGLEVPQGDRMDDNQTGRRKSAFARRKSSAVVDEAPQAIVEASALNAADRRLAEMGYVQVRRLRVIWPSLSDFAMSSRSTSASSPGCPPSPSPWPSPASSPVYRPPSYIRMRPEVPRRPSGAG